MTIAGLTLEEIEALCARATDGPWRTYPDPDNDRMLQGMIVSPAGDAELGNWFVAGDVRWADNRAFIAAARTLVPGLVERVRELEAALQEWRECALYDAMMEGPVFKGWNISALNRCRLKNAALPAPPKEKGETT